MEEFNPVFVPKTDATKFGHHGCPFNQGLNCDGLEKSNCKKCGWNPVVEESRKEALRRGGLV